MDIDLNRFRETFFLEADEHVSEMEAALLAPAGGRRDPELLNSVSRGAHFIKGAAGTFGYESVTKFTYALESFVDRMRAGGAALTPPAIDLLLRAVETLGALLASARTGSPAPDAAGSIDELLTATLGGTEPDSARAATPRTTKTAALDGGPVWRIAFAPSRDVFRQGIDPVLVIRELGCIGTIVSNTIDASAVPALDELDPEDCHLCWRVRLASGASWDEIRDVFAFVDDGADIEITREGDAGQSRAPAEESAGPTRAASRESSTIRVATAKVDKLIDLVGELVIAQSTAAQALNGFTPARLPALMDAFAEVERHTRELQERIMGVRTLPVANVFARMQRLVHDLAATTGKSVRLEISGEETELDKTLVEGIGDPLMHIIRDAIDHGIEPPDERLRSGKPAQALVTLRAYHEGGCVVIEIGDDGRGISGRGVGMDVVRRNVEALNGSVMVESEPGRGSIIRLRLPLTPAIPDGLLLNAGGQKFVLPLVSILESIRPARSQVRTVAGSGEVVMLRGEPVPPVRLHRLFDVAAKLTDPSEGIAVVVENQGRRLALLVDELLGQQQVVIKSLETNYHREDGFVGATIPDDGRPALIVDVPCIAAMAAARARQTSSVHELVER